MNIRKSILGGNVTKPIRRLGVAATELAVLLPLLCFLFVIAVDYGRIFYYTVTVTNCARNGALYGSQDPTKANDQTSIATEAKRDAPNLVANSVNVSSATNSSTNPTYVTVTVTYPFTTITNFPGVTKTTTITRTVRMEVTPWTVSTTTVTTPVAVVAAP
jgi:Flp pilus assembly protein TadG